MSGDTTRACVRRFLKAAFLGLPPLLATCTASVGADSALHADVSVIVDVAGAASGGLRQGLRAMDRADLALDINGDAIGLPGLSGHIDGMSANGGGLSGLYVGDLQGVSNIDAPDGVTLYEAWIEKTWGEKAAVKFGIVDLNSEFDVQDVGVLFVNSSFGIAPEYSHAGAIGPSIFPTPGLGGRAQVKISGQVMAKAGVFDAVPRDPEHLYDVDLALSSHEGALVVAEIDAAPFSSAKVKVGFWQYTARFAALDQYPDGAAPRFLYGNSGFYGSLSARLYSEADATDRGLDGWIRVGSACSAINPVAAYLGGGFVYTGLIAGREADQIGVAVASAFIGEPARHAAALAGAPLMSNETAIELTYAAPVLSWLVVQPDLQYVVHPGASPDTADALVLGLRLAANWSPEDML